VVGGRKEIRRDGIGAGFYGRNEEMEEVSEPIQESEEAMSQAERDAKVKAFREAALNAGASEQTRVEPSQMWRCSEPFCGQVFDEEMSASQHSIDRGHQVFRVEPAQTPKE